MSEQSRTGRCQICHTTYVRVRLHSGLLLCDDCYDDFDEIDARTIDDAKVEQERRQLLKEMKS